MAFDIPQNITIEHFKELILKKIRGKWYWPSTQPSDHCLSIDSDADNPSLKLVAHIHPGINKEDTDKEDSETQEEENRTVLLQQLTQYMDMLPPSERNAIKKVMNEERIDKTTRRAYQRGIAKIKGLFQYLIWLSMLEEKQVPKINELVGGRNGYSVNSVI